MPRRCGYSPHQRRGGSLRSRTRHAAADRPNLVATTTTKAGGKTDRSAEQEAKAQLASDLDAIKNAQEAFAYAYSNNEKILAAMRSAGLVEEGDYYEQKKALLDSNTASQVAAQEQTIARLPAIVAAMMVGLSIR
ncbi:hypothetical protein [Variovorax sp. LT1R20]|uniref:hypothetical protein n=1 Tax=Variovorax sp. LT1R20 TaxID=3443729 RepID=UPI003F491682